MERPIDCTANGKDIVKSLTHLQEPHRDLPARGLRLRMTPWRGAGIAGGVHSLPPAADLPQDGAPPPRPDMVSRLLPYVLLAALMLALPLALKAGAEFFLPVTAAVVVAIALVPALEWLERRRLPSSLAAAICVLLSLAVVNGALALIILPASVWFIELPQRLPVIRANLTPLIDFYASLQAFIERALQAFASSTAAQAQAVAIETPSSMLDYLSTSAPAAAIQTFFAVLLMFFLLSGWTSIRRSTINSRSDFNTAMQTARVIQNVVNATAAYLSTIVVINLLLGAAVAAILWLLGMPSPLMWGGIVALCNFVPYIGPLLAALLLAMGGLMTYDNVAIALLPAAVLVALHTLEANVITPLVLGRRLTINPTLILLSLSFWGWVWGAPGAFLAVPLLIIVQTVISSLRPADDGPAAAPVLEPVPER